MLLSSAMGRYFPSLTIAGCLLSAFARQSKKTATAILILPPHSRLRPNRNVAPGPSRLAGTHGRLDAA